MLRQRLDFAPTPDVDVMMSMLCDARQPGFPNSWVASTAAVKVLNRYAVPAKLAAVQLVALNKVAVERLPVDGSLDMTVPVTPDRQTPELPWVGHSGGWPHAVVNVSGSLLALALDEYRREKAGFNPQPGFFEVPADFWDGTDAIFLAGDDGSGMFLWTVPSEALPSADPHAVEQEVDRLTRLVDAAGHPGWRTLTEV